MTDAEILAKVKNGLGITGEFQDDTLNVYIDEAKVFMTSAGVDPSVVTSKASVGCIMRGVSDLWNYGSGGGKLSEYFKMRVQQLKKTAILFITQAAGTTVSVLRGDGTALSNESVLNHGNVLTITVAGGTVTVNGSAFTSGGTITVSGVMRVVSTAAEAVNGNE